MKSEFIQIGDVRIKRSNIKSFGLAVETRGEDKTVLASFVRGVSGFVSPKDDDSIIQHAKSINLGILGNVMSRLVSAETEAKKVPGKKYMYITTYQNDNFTFYESEVDIEKALKELNDEPAGG